MGAIWERAAICLTQNNLAIWISRFARYGSIIQALPREEQVRIDQITRYIIRSYDSDCKPIRTIRLIGHADRDPQRGAAFEKKVSGDHARAVQEALIRAINQYRRGITNKDEREFLAFHWASMTQEKPGTGCLQHAMRRDMIDCAIGYLNCLPSADQQKYAQERSALLSRRTLVNGTHGNPTTNPPTNCQRCNL